MKNLLLPLLTLYFAAPLTAQADYYVNLTKPNKQLNSTFWKDSQGQEAFTIRTQKRDLLRDRKDATFYKAGKEQYSLARKKTNWILTGSEKGKLLVYRPFKYVLPNGQVLKRRVKKWGRSLHLEDENGVLVATASILRHPQTRGRLEISIQQETVNDELLAAMLSLDIMGQYRAIFPVII